MSRILTNDEFERLAAARGVLIDIFVSHSPQPRRTGHEIIKAISAEDLKTANYWYFKLNGKVVIIPSWFINALKSWAK
jgi:hypothetical protein